MQHNSIIVQRYRHCHTCAIVWQILVQQPKFKLVAPLRNKLKCVYEFISSGWFLSTRSTYISGKRKQMAKLTSLTRTDF
jgi:hypothetical protein